MKLQYHVLLRHFTLAVLFGLAWQPPTVHAQAIPTQDSYVVSAKVNQNNGGDVILAVQPGITTFIQFD